MSQNKTGGKAYTLLSDRIRHIKKAKRIFPQLILCPHCKKLLTLKTYKKHKKLYYRNHRWKINSSYEDNNEDYGYEEEISGVSVALHCIL